MIRKSHVLIFFNFLKDLDEVLQPMLILKPIKFELNITVLLRVHMKVLKVVFFLQPILFLMVTKSQNVMNLAQVQKTPERYTCLL